MRLKPTEKELGLYEAVNEARLLDSGLSLEETLRFDKNYSKIATSFGLASLAAGAFHGFCDAQGIPLDKGLEAMLKYAPTIIQGPPFLLGRLCSPEVVSVKIHTKQFGEWEEKITKGDISVARALSGTILGFTETLLGYGLGYATGYVTKYFS